MLALAIFVFTFYLFHHLLPDGSFTALLFGIRGVTFLPASVMSLLVGRIFFKGK